MKELIRRILFWILPAEMVAQEGTLKFHFLNWLYGNGEPEFDVTWPEDARPSQPPAQKEQPK